MRFIEESGGVAWGDADYELDAIPFNRKLGDLSKTSSIFHVAFFPRGVPERDLMIPELSPKMRARARRPTIVLFEGDQRSFRSFRLRWPRESEPLEALARVCAIERRVGGEVPPWLVTACYVAGQAWQMGVMDEIRVGMATSIASAFALALRGTLVAGDLDDVAIREMAQQLLLARRADELRVPRDPWGMARMVWQISALVWSEEGAERIVEDYITGGSPWGIASSAMPVWGVLHKPRLIELLEDDWPSDLEEAARAMMRFWTQRVAPARQQQLLRHLADRHVVQVARDRCPPERQGKSASDAGRHANPYLVHDAHLPGLPSDVAGRHQPGGNLTAHAALNGADARKRLKRLALARPAQAK